MRKFTWQADPAVHPACLKFAGKTMSYIALHCNWNGNYQSEIEFCSILLFGGPHWSWVNACELHFEWSFQGYLTQSYLMRLNTVSTVFISHSIRQEPPETGVGIGWEPDCLVTRGSNRGHFSCKQEPPLTNFNIVRALLWFISGPSGFWLFCVLESRDVDNGENSIYQSNWLVPQLLRSNRPICSVC